MLLGVLLGGVFALPAPAGWDPANGDWSPAEPTDVRVMTWNLLDGIRSDINKTYGENQWTAIAAIVASLKPDVLLLQETGDSSGGVDSVAELETTIDLFLHGGYDPFTPGNPEVTAYVQYFDPAYDLPYVFVTTASDSYNRNVILSRYPFRDLNGDGRRTYNDIPYVYADEYAPGGTGGIRGFQFVEIDLPNRIYGGDLVAGNGHLKAGSTSTDLAQRLTAAKNIAYLIDYWYNGAGGDTPDPHAKILDNPAATQTLDGLTALVIGGDWNEDELNDGRKGPAEWFTQAEVAGSPDGTDRDRGDMTYDSSVHYFTGSRATHSSSKLDYLAWQDSISQLRESFVFRTVGTPTGSMPPELLLYPWPAGASGIASDHSPVIADLILPGLSAVESGGDSPAPTSDLEEVPYPGPVSAGPTYDSAEPRQR